MIFAMHSAEQKQTTEFGYQRSNSARKRKLFPESPVEAKRQIYLCLLLNSGTTELHEAAIDDDVARIESLMASRCKDLNRRSPQGQTPLILAIFGGKYRAAQCLLNHEAADLSRGKIWPLQQTECIAKQQAADQSRDCFVDQLSLTGDAEMLGQALDQLTSINSEDSKTLVERALDLNNPEIVRMLLKRGVGSADRRRTFFSRVTRDLDDPKTRPYFDQVVKWEVIDQDMLSPSVWSFRCEREDLYDALLDIGIAQYARQKFGIELLARHFCFEVVDWAEKQRKYLFDVNGLDLLGFSALHWACILQTNEDVAHLLKQGADPNLRGRRGQTPLFYATSDETVRLLIEAGADVLIRDQDSLSMLDVEPLSDYISAHVGYLSKKGLLKYVTGPYQYVHKTYRLDFELMKTVRVFESGASLYSILFDSATQTALFVKNQETIDAIVDLIIPCRFEFYSYKKMLMKKLKDALEVNQLRLITGVFLSRVMSIADPNHLTIEHILGYLTYQDLLTFRKLEH